MDKRKDFLSGEIISPPTITDHISLVELVERTFLSYNAGRLREACQVYTQKMLKEEVTIGVSLMLEWVFFYKDSRMLWFLMIIMKHTEMELKHNLK